MDEQRDSNERFFNSCRGAYALRPHSKSWVFFRKRHFQVEVYRKAKKKKKDGDLDIIWRVLRDKRSLQRGAFFRAVSNETQNEVPLPEEVQSVANGRRIDVTRGVCGLKTV